MIIIGIVGRIGSGKTTVSGHLCEKYAFKKYSIAEPLKKIGLILGFTEKELYVDKTTVNADFGVTGREFLQKFGTEICRELLPTIIPGMESIWIRLLKKYFRGKSDKARIIIDDVRFPDELEALKEFGAVIIELKRGEEDTSENRHASEFNIEGADHVIENNGCLLELFNAIDSIMAGIECQPKRVRFSSLKSSTKRGCVQCCTFTSHRCACRSYVCRDCNCDNCI